MSISKFQQQYASFEKVVEFNTSGEDPVMMIEPTRIFYRDQGAIEFRDPNRSWLIFFGFDPKGDDQQVIAG